MVAVDQLVGSHRWTFISLWSTLRRRYTRNQEVPMMQVLVSRLPYGTALPDVTVPTRRVPGLVLYGWDGRNHRDLGPSLIVEADWFRSGV